MNRNGSGLRRLTTPATSDNSFSDDIDPKWSPDGTRVLFTRMTMTVSDPNADEPDLTLTTALYTVSTSGPATVSPVTAAPRGFAADWSPDGTQIVFAAMPPSTPQGNPFPSVGRLSIVNADGTGTPRDLGVTGSTPAWAPDGTTIAYSTITRTNPRTGEETSRLALVPADGGTPSVLAATQPTAAASSADAPTWLPDGSSLAYTYYDGDENLAIWAVDRQGTRAGRVVAGVGDGWVMQPSVHGPAPKAVTAGTAASFTAVVPERILDTRKAIGAPKAKVGPAGTLALTVRGAKTGDASTVPVGASAVVLNVTVLDASAATDVRVYPSGRPVPDASSVNAPKGGVVPNLVTVPLGADGKVMLRNSAGSVNLLADIAGYYTPDADGAPSAGAGYAPLEPGRILDTRRAPGAKLGEGRTLDLQVVGDLPTGTGRTLTVPSSATAVVLNVTLDAVLREHRRAGLPDADRRRRAGGQQPQRAGRPGHREPGDRRRR